MKISVIIPCYKDPGNLKELLEYFSNKDVEIIVIYDNPTKEGLEIVKKYQVRLFIREKRAGKVSALNLGIKNSKGDYLLFVDSDVEIREDILEDIKKFESFDVIDFKKRIIVNGFLKKMIDIDYIGFNISTEVMSKYGKCIGINGSIFCVKKSFLEKIGLFQRYILEDVEFGIRAFEGSYIQTDKTVFVGAPNNFKEFLKQRTRWYNGFFEIVTKKRKDYMKKIRFYGKNFGKMLIASAFSILYLILLPIFGIFGILIAIPIAKKLLKISWKDAILYSLYKLIDFPIIIRALLKRNVDWVVE